MLCVLVDVAASFLFFCAMVVGYYDVGVFFFCLALGEQGICRTLSWKPLLWQGKTLSAVPEKEIAHLCKNKS